MTKILLVEDDKSLREIYGVRLLAEGYDIVSAGDGEEALAMAIKEKPTLIISDVMMPKISGFDMLDILRSTTETRDIKVIMMTALSSDDQRTRGEQLGADRYLVKSQVGIEDVVRTVHEVLSDTPSGAAAAPATDSPAPAADAPAADAPAPAQPAADDSAKPAEDTTAPAADTPAPAIASPGNEEAGPLPPQPTETKPAESTLPQPTAPFSSPRPANLGEEALHPETPASDSTVTPEEMDQVKNELQASAEPVANTQVDEAIGDADVEAPASEPAGHVAPSLEGIDQKTDNSVVNPSPVTPDLSAPLSPQPENNDEKPTISGTSTPIS